MLSQLELSAEDNAKLQKFWQKGVISRSVIRLKHCFLKMMGSVPKTIGSQQDLNLYTVYDQRTNDQQRIPAAEVRGIRRATAVNAFLCTPIYDRGS